MNGPRRRRETWYLRSARFLEPALAQLLHYGPSHGYTLTEQLAEFGLGDLDRAVVYRALREMEEDGWVISAWDTQQTQGPPRRVYSLTEVGDQMLLDCVQDLQRVREQLDFFLSSYRRHMIEGEGEYHDA